MSNFVRIGKHRINLDHVTEVKECGDDMVRVYWDYAVSGEYQDRMAACDEYLDDEARLLLAIIDQDDEQVDALYAKVNGKKTDPYGEAVPPLEDGLEGADEDDEDDGEDYFIDSGLLDCGHSRSNLVAPAGKPYCIVCGASV